MYPELKSEEQPIHRKIAVNTYNAVWDLIDKAERSHEEDELMIHMSHASRFHWQLVGKKLNYQRGEWQLARVYTLVNRVEPALHHAKLCLELTEAPTLENGFTEFDVAFANEAMARASALAGDAEGFRKYYDQAKIEGEKIKKKGDHEVFQKELSRGPWSGFVK